jgi:amino acid transporter
MGDHGSSGLKRNVMGTGEIVFLVIAFAAPLAASTSNIPIAIGFGNGIGAPGAWALIGIVLALFSVAYAAMSRHLTNSGAFYAFITAGLGRRLGVGAGYVAMVAYASSVILIAGFLGFFASDLLASELGIHVAWPWPALASLVAVSALAYAGTQASVRLLGVLLVVETALLVAIILAILLAEGPGAYPLSSFEPSNVLSGTPGLAFAFVVSTYLGFEATAIFSEEARDPKRTVRRATLIAIAVIALLYTAASWSIVAALGVDRAPAVAADDPGAVFFDVAGTYLGAWAVTVFHVLIVTSLFAVLIAAHNSAARYIYSLARDGWLPKALATTHDERRSPYVASILQVGISAVVVAAYAIAGADPLTQLGATFIGLQALGILGLMALVSIAAIGFFRRRDYGVGSFTAVIAPALSAIALTICGVMVVDNFALISGTDSKIAAFLPLLLLIALAVGALVAGRGVGDDPEDLIRDAPAGAAPDDGFTAPPVGVTAAIAHPEE